MIAPMLILPLFIGDSYVSPDSALIPSDSLIPCPYSSTTFMGKYNMDFTVVMGKISPKIYENAAKRTGIRFGPQSPGRSSNSPAQTAPQ